MPIYSGFNMMFDKILFPTDFSESSNRALGYAIKVTQHSDAELIILHAFRLIQNTNYHSTIKKVNIKKEMERKAILNFEQWDKQLNQLGLDYSFVSEVGFLSERIHSTVSARNIDLVILYNDIHQKVFELDEEGGGRFIQDIQCPVMFIPKEA